MTYRLPGDRQPLGLDGPHVEVEPCRSFGLQRTGIGLYAAVEAAKDADALMSALVALGRFVMAEAQPVWDILDHRGPVPATELGFLRLPTSLQLEISLGWLGTYGAKAEPESAVDAIIAPGPANREIKRRLRAVKAA